VAAILEGVPEKVQGSIPGVDPDGVVAFGGVFEPASTSRAQSIVSLTARSVRLAKAFPVLGAGAGAPLFELEDYVRAREDVFVASVNDMLYDKADLFDSFRRRSPVPAPDTVLETMLYALFPTKSAAEALIATWGRGMVDEVMRPATKIGTDRLYYAIGDYLGAWFAQDGADDAEGMAWACAPIVLSLIQGFAVQVTIRGNMNPRQYVAGMRVLFEFLGPDGD